MRSRIEVRGALQEKFHGDKPLYQIDLGNQKKLPKELFEYIQFASDSYPLG